MSCAATLLALAHTVKAPSAHNKARLSRNSPIFLASGATSGACTAFTSPDKRASVANAISGISEVYLPASKVTANIVRKLNTFKPQPTPQVVQEHHSHGRLTIENLTVAAAEIARPLEVPIYNHALLQTWDPPAAAAVVTRSPRFRQPRPQVAAMTSLPLVEQSAYPAIFSHALLPRAATLVLRLQRWSALEPFLLLFAVQGHATVAYIVDGRNTRTPWCEGSFMGAHQETGTPSAPFTPRCQTSLGSSPSSSSAPTTYPATSPVPSVDSKELQLAHLYHFASVSDDLYADILALMRTSEVSDPAAPACQAHSPPAEIISAAGATIAKEAAKRQQMVEWLEMLEMLDD
ncbi:hypothetical protein JCM11641_005143 [Rhodosporidiobolus odoratus]